MNTWVAPAIVFLLGLLLFSINLDRPPHPDELHNALAAQSLLETGRPILAEGEYWRGILYTYLVAFSYEVFGEGLASSRIPSVLLVALIAPILFLWVRREAGSLAAWLTAVLFISSPFTVEIAQFCRFYSTQVFFFILGSICVYYTVGAALPLLQRLILGAIAIVLLYLARDQQVTSLVGVLGIAVWASGLILLRAFYSRNTNQAVRRTLIASLLGVAVAFIMVAILTDRIEWMWAKYQEVQVFNLKHKDDFWYYHLRFVLFYPTLWTLVGVLAVFAILRNARLAWFAICVFGISFVLMSLAGTKNTRYLSFAPPFLTILWGTGLAGALQLLRQHANDTRTRLVETIALPKQVGSRVVTAGVLLIASMVLLTNPFWLRTATMIGNITLPVDTPNTDWPAAREALAPWTTDADIVITTEELGAIYFLGRSDVRFSLSKFNELLGDEKKEFGIDFRTGRPVISKPESMEKLIECFSQGLVVGPIEHWGDPILISEEIQAIITRHAKPIEVPKESYLYAWGWTREPAATKPSYCTNLSQFSRAGMR